MISRSFKPPHPESSRHFGCCCKLNRTRAGCTRARYEYQSITFRLVPSHPEDTGLCTVQEWHKVHWLHSPILASPYTTRVEPYRVLRQRSSSLDCCMTRSLYFCSVVLLSSMRHVGCLLPLQTDGRHIPFDGITCFTSSLPSQLPTRTFFSSVLDNGGFPPRRQPNQHISRPYRSLAGEKSLLFGPTNWIHSSNG